MLFCAEKTKQINDVTKPKIDIAIEHSRSNLSWVGAPPVNARGVSRKQAAQIERQKNEKAGNSRLICGVGVEKVMMNIHIRTGINVKRTS